MSLSVSPQEATYQSGTIGSSAIEEIVGAAFRQHAPAIQRMALRSTRDAWVAEDVTQEAFLRLIVEAEAGRLPDNIGGWLYRTTANLIISRARRAAVARRYVDRFMDLDGPAQPDRIAVVRERHQELQAALATLPAADRGALLMAGLGATGEEIARHLGRSQGATRTLISRARGRLRIATIEAEALRRRDPEWSHS